MRITAGRLRHRLIDMTNLDTTRETQDKVRMAMFNMLGQFFDGGSALDLFAGSGALAIEAYSRGCDFICLNDLNPKAVEVEKKNCKNLKIDNAKFYNLDYKEFVKKVDLKFDYIFLDPPYKMDNIEEILDDVKNLLTNNGLIIFEMAIESNYNIDNYEIIKNKTYGIKRVVVYRRIYV